MKKIITNNEAETFALGRKIGTACWGGEVFLLSGNLGAGKTRFIQGLAAGLGVRGIVNSPTFNIMKVYETVGPVKTFCHVDAYRLDSASALLDLGIEEYFDSPLAVTAIEWAENVKKIRPERARSISFKTLSETRREITFSGN